MTIHLGGALPHPSSDIPEDFAPTQMPKGVSSYFVLLPVGFALPFLLPKMRCALTAPFHPYL